MDLQVVPRRRLKRRAIGLVVLVLFIPSLFIMLLPFYLAVMTDLDLADPNKRIETPPLPNSGNRFFWLRLSRLRLETTPATTPATAGAAEP